MNPRNRLHVAWSAWLAMVNFLPQQVISGNLEWHVARKWRRCLQDTMITHGHSGRLTSSLAHKYYKNSRME